MEKIIYKYEQLRNTPSDINEHLPVLKKYAEECDTIVEMGVRTIVSTWAFLSANPKKLVSLDLYHPSVYGGNLDEVYDAVSEIETNFSFVEHDSLTYDMDECDLLFIDTWHDFLQLKKELNRHHNKVKKYIILHDTTTFGFQDEIYEDRGETNLPKGLYYSVDEFLSQNKNWVIWEKKSNNNGLTILKRMDYQEKKPIEKKVVLFSTFCDTEEKLNVLEMNIKKVKEIGVDVITISPFNLPEHITKQCDYFFITKDNPILDWPLRAMFGWKGLIINGQTYQIARTYPDYGYAGLTQVKQLSQIALGLGYDQFHHMIYDTKIDENVIEGLNSDKTNSVYPSKRKEDVWTVGLHYLIFNRENLEKFISHLNLEEYIGVKDGDAFALLHSLQPKLNYTIEKTPVEDEIYYYENKDFFNFSPTEDFKLFVVSNDETHEPIKLVFYEIKPELKLIIKVESGEEIIVEDEQIIDLRFNKYSLQEVTIECNSIVYNITEIIKSIKHSSLIEII